MYFDQSKLDMGQKKPFGVTLPHDPAVVAGEVSGSSPFLTFWPVSWALHSNHAAKQMLRPQGVEAEGASTQEEVGSSILIRNG